MFVYIVSVFVRTGGAGGSGQTDGGVSSAHQPRPTSQHHSPKYII